MENKKKRSLSLWMNMMMGGSPNNVTTLKSMETICTVVAKKKKIHFFSLILRKRTLGLECVSDMKVPVSRQEHQGHQWYHPPPEMKCSSQCQQELQTHHTPAYPELWHENLLQPKQASGVAMSTRALETHGEVQQLVLQPLQQNHCEPSNGFLTPPQIGN